MKKARIVLAVMAAGMLLFGCDGRVHDTSVFPSAQSSIFIAQDGQVSSALVETYKNGYYDQAELKASIEEAVAEYNRGLGRNAVTLSSCTMGDGKAIALFDYESSTDLCDFTAEMEDTANQAKTLVLSTVKEGLPEGESSLLWKKGKNGSNVSFGTVKKKGDRNLVAVDGTVTIQTEGKIQYYCGDVSLVDGFTAKINGGRAYLVLK